MIKKPMEKMFVFLKDLDPATRLTQVVHFN
jgi:hypothetical protein